MVTAQFARRVENGVGRRDGHLENADRGPHVAQTVLQSLERTSEALGARHAPGVDESQKPYPARQRIAVELLPARFNEREGRKRAKDLRKRRRSSQKA